MKAGGLNMCYLHQWLKDTCSGLVKLEKEAAPEGWLLQWDRYASYSIMLGFTQMTA